MDQPNMLNSCFRSTFRELLLIVSILHFAHSQIANQTSKITLNLLEGQKTAYLEPGYVSFAEVPSNSILADPDAVVFPQFGLDREPTLFEEELNLNDPMLVYHFFDAEFSVVLQIGLGIGSPTRFCKFQIENKAYTKSPTCYTTNITDLSWPLLGNNTRLLKSVNPDLEMDNLLQDDPIQEKKMSFAFVAINNVANLMRTVICIVTLDSPPQCKIAYTKAIDPVREEISNLQVVHSKALIYLKSFVLEVPCMLGVNSTLLQLDSSLRYVQYYNGGWWGIDSSMHLCALSTVESQVPDQDFVKGNITVATTLKMIRAKSYKTTADMLFTTLAATENYLVSVFKNNQLNTTGVTVFGYVKPSTLSTIEPTIGRVRQLQMSVESLGTQSNSLDKVLYEFDYYYLQAPQMHSFFEWQGNLVLFGNRALMILTIPWTVGGSSSTKILYPSAGSVNKTYNMHGANILYVLPTDAKSVDSLAILSLNFLMGPESNKQSSRILPAAPKPQNRLSLTQVEVMSPYLQFEKYSDEVLLSKSPLSVDFYYNDYPLYKKLTFEIEFKKVANKKDIKLISSLVAMGVLLVVAFVVCAMKSHKAINQPRDSTSMMDHTIKGGKDVPPMHNVQRPARHSKDSEDSRWKNDSKAGTSVATGRDSNAETDLYRFDPSPRFGKVMINDELPTRLLGKHRRSEHP